ncbi:RluA family pseudouridine synthase [Candidatus Sumerlaeota bacterium]|nr:RluA family pseudouridine synthase [Candidatus Sumerlaeota bacterium]
MEFIIETAGERLDVYLSDRLTELTRSRLRRLIDEGAVLVDGSRAKSGLKLKPGMRVTLDLPEPAESGLEPEDLPLDVVFEDDQLIVINKAAGMVTHPAAGNATGTLVHALLYHCRDLRGVGDEKRPGIVHRIDKNTSGLLAVAKTNTAHVSLCAQLEKHSMRREYQAVALDAFRDAEGAVDAPIGRNQQDRKKMGVTRKGGRVAVTHWRVEHRALGLALVRCRLETGRTHQIRVHLQSIGCPVLCDPEYGPRQKTVLAVVPKTHEPLRSMLAKTKRQLLHACALRLQHPVSGEWMEFHAPLPQDMQCVWEYLLGIDESGGMESAAQTF